MAQTETETETKAEASNGLGLGTLCGLPRPHIHFPSISFVADVNMIIAVIAKLGILTGQRMIFLAPSLAYLLGSQCGK